MDPTQTQDVYREILKHVDDPKTLRTLFAADKQKLELSLQYEFLRSLIVDTLGKVKTDALIDIVRRVNTNEFEILQYIFKHVVFPVQRRKALGLPPRAVISQSWRRQHVDFEELCINHVVTTVKNTLKPTKETRPGTKCFTCVINETVIELDVKVDESDPAPQFESKSYNLPRAMFETLRNYDGRKIPTDADIREVFARDPRARDIARVELDKRIEDFWSELMFQLYCQIFRPLEHKLKKQPTDWPADGCMFLVTDFSTDFQLPLFYTTDLVLAGVSLHIFSSLSRITPKRPWAREWPICILAKEVFFEDYLNQDEPELFEETFELILKELINDDYDFSALVAEAGKKIPASLEFGRTTYLPEQPHALREMADNLDFGLYAILPAQPLPWDQILNNDLTVVME